MSAAITIATIASAAAAVGGTAYSVYAGGQQQDAQKKALQQQKNAQTQAEQNALDTTRKNDIAQNAANQKVPDIAGILARAAQTGSTGLTGTMLTGPSGVDPTALNLSKSTLLGK